MPGICVRRPASCRGHALRELGHRHAREHRERRARAHAGDLDQQPERVALARGAGSRRAGARPRARPAASAGPRFAERGQVVEGAHRHVDQVADPGDVDQQRRRTTSRAGFLTGGRSSARDYTSGPAADPRAGAFRDPAPVARQRCPGTTRSRRTLAHPSAPAARTARGRQCAVRRDGRGQRPGVGVADRAGERVRGVRRGQARQTEEALHHRLHLRLGRAPVSDHRLLDLQGGVLVDRQPAATSVVIAAPRACPSSSVDWGLTLTKTISTTALCGWYWRSTSPMPVVDRLQPGRQRLRARCGSRRSRRRPGAGRRRRSRRNRWSAGRDRCRGCARDARPGSASQCRKWRTPVNTIATPRSSAAAITSSSRIEPPGWITATAPASTTTSRPSRNGKNASEATTEPPASGRRWPP